MKTCRVMIILTFHGFLISSFDPHCVCVCAVQNLWRCWLNECSTDGKHHKETCSFGQTWQTMGHPNHQHNSQHIAQSAHCRGTKQGGSFQTRDWIYQGLHSVRRHGREMSRWLAAIFATRATLHSLQIYPDSSTPQLIKPPDSQGLVLTKGKFTHHWWTSFVCVSLVT